MADWVIGTAEANLNHRDKKEFVLVVAVIFKEVQTFDASTEPGSVFKLLIRIQVCNTLHSGEYIVSLDPFSDFVVVGGYFLSDLGLPEDAKVETDLRVHKPGSGFHHKEPLLMLM